MTEKDWYVGRNNDSFEVDVLLDVDGEWTSTKPRYLVEMWVYRFGFEPMRTFDSKEKSLRYAQKQADKYKGRYRVLRAPEGKSFEVLNG